MNAQLKLRVVFGSLALMSIGLTIATQSPIAGILTGLLIGRALLIKVRP